MYMYTPLLDSSYLPSSDYIIYSMSSIWSSIHVYSYLLPAGIYLYSSLLCNLTLLFYLLKYIYFSSGLRSLHQHI